MWTTLRQNIETIRQEKQISEREFKPVDIYTWQDIQQKIFTIFCTSRNNNNHLTWLWADLKLDTYSIHFDKNWPFEAFLPLVDPSEKVWLFVNETVNKGTKFWFYEGLINTIVFVLKESFVDEVYIASKKYEWLLCLNHHDVLIATGQPMVDKLKKLENELLTTKQSG